MSKITIIEGNSNDKDNTRAFMVKGEKGVSPTISTTKEGDTATVVMTDGEGTHTFTLSDGADGVSPTVSTSKTGGVTTITIIDANGTHTATINDGEVSEAELTQALSGKANTSHTHTKSQITDFAHTHTKSDITDFSHTHTKSDITDFAHTHDDRYYTETESDSRYKLQGDFALITGNFSTEQSSLRTKSLSFPTGFTPTNCVVVSYGVKNSLFNTWYYEYLSSGSFTKSISFSDLDSTPHIYVSTETTGTFSSIETISYRIVLMKVS